MFRRVREDWRTDRARLLWFFGHSAALAALTVLTHWRGRVWVVGAVIITASYGIGYVVLIVRGVRRARSASSNRQE